MFEPNELDLNISAESRSRAYVFNDITHMTRQYDESPYYNTLSVS
jgi:hypothetical protein